jgi:AcrR family transcriptional regulator
MLTAADDSRERIVASAEALFKRYGYGKTTVAEIARDAGMSPANVYRFFDGKAEIVAAIAELWLSEMEALARRIALRKEPASKRLRAYAVEIHRRTVERYLENEKIHDMCQMVISEQWPIVQGHIERMREIVTLIVADGMQDGEFAAADPGRTAGTIKDTFIKFHHPTIVAQCQAEPLESQLHAVCDLGLAALAPR